MNKKGMEMWQLLFLLGALILLLVMLLWFGVLKSDLTALLEKAGGLFG